MTDLLTAALALDALWAEPDPGTEDAAEGLIWVTDFEDDGIPRTIADALRGLRAAIRQAEGSAIVDAITVGAVVHVGDPDDRARSYNAGFEGWSQALAGDGIDEVHEQQCIYGCTDPLTCDFAHERCGHCRAARAAAAESR